MLIPVRGTPDGRTGPVWIVAIDALDLAGTSPTEHVPDLSGVVDGCLIRIRRTTGVMALSANRVDDVGALASRLDQLSRRPGKIEIVTGGKKANHALLSRMVTPSKVATLTANPDRDEF